MATSFGQWEKLGFPLYARMSLRLNDLYLADQDGVPIRDDPNKPIKGKVVVKIPEKDGEFCSPSI